MKQKIGFAIGVLLILSLIFSEPWAPDRKQSDFTQIFTSWGEQQAATSDKFTTHVVSGVEGGVIGEHRVDGSNWAIPNIIRHWLGVD